MVALPFCQPAGQTSPCSSVNLKASTRRKTSSTLRPTGKSLIVICLTTPSGEMMNKPGSKSGKKEPGWLARDYKKDLILSFSPIHTTKSDTSIFKQDTIVTSNLLGLVSKNRNVHLTKTTLFTWSVDPGQMRKLYTIHVRSCPSYAFLYVICVSSYRCQLMQLALQYLFSQTPWLDQKTRESLWDTQRWSP